MKTRSIERKQNRMKLDSSIVGMDLAVLEHEVTWRETMNYAASVGDVNPSYFEDTRPEGIIAPPLFAVAVTWPFIGNARKEERIERLLPAEIMVTMVHATEHLVFHRPVRPGDHLSIQGKVAAVLPGPKGSLMVLRLEARDKEGEQVFTEYGGAFFRGVGCQDGGRGKEDLPTVPQYGISSRPEWEVTLPIPLEAAHVYDGCTDMVFPIHTSRAFAREVGLPDTILQGTATLAMASREIVNRESDGEPGRLREISCRFAGMVFPGTSIRVVLTAKEKRDEETLLGFRVLNAEGRTVIRRGFARIG